MIYEVVESIIANGDTDSDLVDLGNRAVVGLIVPTIDSGTLTFKVAAYPTDTPILVKDKTLTTLTVSASTGALALDGDSIVGLSGYRWIQIIAGAAQTAARTFKWVVKG